MREDAGRGFDDGPERERLRARLREWTVPEAPRALEDDLRRELKRSRGGRRWRLWVPLAAGLAGLAAWPLVPERMARSVEAPSASPTSGPRGSDAPGLPLASDDTGSRRAPVQALAAGTGRRRGAAPPPRSVVVVEPAQAELLAAFGRRAWETPAASGGSAHEGLLTMEAPPYRGEWRELEGEWPTVQVVEPSSGR